MYMFTLGIFLRFECIFGMEKSFRLPIKGGAWAHVKGFTTFEASTGFQRFFVSSLFLTLVCLFQTLVLGDSL
jgi:hypothetical protein